MASFIFKLMALFLEASAGLPGLRDSPALLCHMHPSRTMNRGLALLVYPEAGCC